MKFRDPKAMKVFDNCAQERIDYSVVRRCHECAECGPYCDPNAYESCQKRKTDGSCWRRYEEIIDAE